MPNLVSCYSSPLVATGGLLVPNLVSCYSSPLVATVQDSLYEAVMAHKVGFCTGWLGMLEKKETPERQKLTKI